MQSIWKFQMIRVPIDEKKRNYSRHYHQISWELTENVELTACIDVLKVGKKAIGDVHAVHVTCSHAPQVTRFHLALRKIISDDLHAGNRHRGDPDPETTARNRQILERTLLRHKTMSTDEDVVEFLDASDNELAQAVHRFLECWNGSGLCCSFAKPKHRPQTILQAYRALR